MLNSNFFVCTITEAPWGSLQTIHPNEWDGTLVFSSFEFVSFNSHTVLYSLSWVFSTMICQIVWFSPYLFWREHFDEEKRAKGDLEAQKRAKSFDIFNVKIIFIMRFRWKYPVFINWLIYWFVALTFSYAAFSSQFENRHSINRVKQYSVGRLTRAFYSGAILVPGSWFINCMAEISMHTISQNFNHSTGGNRTRFSCHVSAMFGYVSAMACIWFYILMLCKILLYYS